MPDPKNDKKRRPLRNPTPDRFQMPKVLLIWVIIVGAVVALWAFNPGKVAGPAILNISQVVQMAEPGTSQGLHPAGQLRRAALGGHHGRSAADGFRGARVDGRARAHQQFRGPGRLTDTNLEKLQASQKFEEVPATNMLTQIASQIIPFVIIIGLLYFLFVRQLRQAGRGALSFGKSRAKMLRAIGRRSLSRKWPAATRRRRRSRRWSSS
jgi:cell division protease FtsH